MTTERKIEIATEVVENGEVGSFDAFGDAITICNGLYELERKGIVSLSERHIFFMDIKDYYNKIYNVSGKYRYFFTRDDYGREQRKELLNKYIEHLKQQSNDK